MPLQVDVVSPERVLFSGEAEMVVCRTPDGEVAFLTGHAPFLGALSIGEVRIKPVTGDEVKADIQGGFVEVRDNKVSILGEVTSLEGPTA